MCRWLAYSGSPVPLETFLLQPDRSLIDQSLHARMGVVTTNGDGFGVGWYGEGREPCLYRSIAPAWNNQNLSELAAHVRSGVFLAHIRASTGTAIQQTNCHPFRHDRWLWMHNGLIRGFSTIKRELSLAVDPDLFASIEGSTDSELMFYLALSLGLAEDPVAAVERMAGFVEKTAESHGIENPLRMSVATTDGERLWVFRYSTEHSSPSLFYSTHVRTLRALYPDNPRLEGVSEEARLIVSEPLSDLPGVWNEIPEASCGVVQAGQYELRHFVPRM
jgi:predicted glutamine amidotransferase